MKAIQDLESSIGEEVLICLRKIMQAISLHSRTLVKQVGLTGPQLTRFCAHLGWTKTSFKGVSAEQRHDMLNDYATYRAQIDEWQAAGEPEAPAADE